QTGLIPNVEAVKAVAAVLEAKAERDGALETAHLRVGSHGGRPYLDLCDRTRCAVEFYAGVWNLIDRSPVAFRRPEGTGALPVPQRGGSIEDLRKYVNVTDAQFPLVIGWLAAALLPTGPYPILNLIGEQGSAKSTVARVCRLLIDPHASPLRVMPQNVRDLMA